MGFEDIAEMKRRLVENGNADDGTMFIAQHFSITVDIYMMKQWTYSNRQDHQHL